MTTPVAFQHENIDLAAFQTSAFQTTRMAYAFSTEFPPGEKYEIDRVHKYEKLRHGRSTFRHITTNFFE